MTTENSTLVMRKGSTLSDALGEYVCAKRDGKVIDSINLHYEDLMAIRTMKDNYSLELPHLSDCKLFGLPVITRMD